MTSTELRQLVGDTRRLVTIASDDLLALADQLDRLTAIVDDATACLDKANATLAAIRRDVKGLHQRRCWPCQVVHWHASDHGPLVACPECGSMDTRRMKD